MATAPFPINPELTAVAVRYRNTRFIADMVAPRLPVGTQTFKYWVHAMAEDFTIPDTRVGRRSRPAEIEFSATEQTAATKDYGLDDPVPQADIDNAPANHDPLMRATEGLADLIALDRERRVAGLVFAAGNYASGNKTTLSGSSQWSDSTSDPITAIGDALDVPIMRPNVGVIGRPAFTKLRSHPSIVKAVQGNSGDAGRATAQQIADLFELDQLLVGEAWVNAAKRGQTASLARVWGKHLALVYLDRQADAGGNRASFCWTAEWGSRVAGAVPDRDIGLRGGQRVRVRYPTDAGHKDGEFRARFRLLPTDQAAALAQQDDPLAAMMRAAVAELLDLEDDAGQPLAHSPELLAAVLAIPFMKLGLSQAYMESVTVAPAKN